MRARHNRDRDPTGVGATTHTSAEMAGGKVNHAELRQAVRDLQNRGLLHSARWAAEQLYGLADEVPVAAHDATPTQLRDDDDDEMEMETPARGFEEESLWRGRGGTAETAGDDYVLAKAYFDLGEYRRASHQLSENRTSLGRFLRYYALYLAGEKRKNEEMLEVGGSALGGHVPGPGGAGASGAGGAPPAGAGGKGPRPRRDVVNAELETIAFDLPVILADDSEEGAETRDDPFLHYLHGLVLVERDQKEEARDALCAACRGYPCNWSAWEAIMPLCATVDEVKELPLPDHWMRKWFIAALQLELQENRKGLQSYANLVKEIPASAIGVVQMAVGHYNMREFDRAQNIFEDVYSADPYRLEGMDIYSNILYVKEESAKLSYLAHSAVLTDKYRPETCCIVGNYYSLKAQHEKAVVYFSRALRLNWRYLSAWTLMGHEYVEMKNPAAIDAVQARGGHQPEGLSRVVWPRADVRDFANAVLRAVLLPARDAAATEGSSHVVRNGSVLRERSAADDGGGDPMLPTRGDVERHGGHRAGETGQIASGERQSEGGGALLPAQPGAPGERGGGHGGDGGGIAVLGELLQKVREVQGRGGVLHAPAGFRGTCEAGRQGAAPGDS